jgi:iron-sulfur cluster assembly protein
MAMMTLQPGTSAPPEAASALKRDPLAGMTVLQPDTVEGQVAPKGIQITKNALKRIRIAMAKEGVSPDQGGLRVGITGGGCSGLSYNIRFDSQARERDRTYSFGRGVETANDPSLVAAQAAGDSAAGPQPIRIFVDPKSFIYLAGMVLDFEETLMRQGFNFINPNSTKSCGCGSSFSA